MRDGAGRAWTVARTAPAEAGGVWVELDGAAHSQGLDARGLVTVHVPSAGVLVELQEGPGWAAAGLSDEAADWAVMQVTSILGASGHIAAAPEGEHGQR